MQEATWVVWYDASKQPVTTKILDAIDNYRRRFPTYAGPVRVMVHSSEVADVEIIEDATVEVGPYVQANNYWVTAG
jgi:hypothetical protein